MASARNERRALFGGWTWGAVALVIVVAGVTAWRTSADQSQLGRLPGALTGSGAASQVTPVLGTVLLSDDELRRPGAVASIVGWPVEARDVAIQEIIDQDSLWVGPTEADRLLVVLIGGADVGSLVTGQNVNLRGHVRDAAALPAEVGSVAAQAQTSLFLEADQIRESR